MTTSAKYHHLAGAAVFLIAMGLYLKTMAPTVSFWDTGEFIACSYTLSIPHPPGSPLYILLGRVFTLLPLGEVAWRVVLMSALSSALAVWCTYLSAAALGRRALGGQSLVPFGDGRDIGVMVGAVVAALSLAVSYTFWFNATEAEVYGYSLFFVCLGVWLIVYWEGTQHGSLNDRWLYLLAYLFGLGGGLHLLCLLTIPALVVLVWFADKQLRRLILIGVGAGLEAMVYLSVFADKPDSAALIGLLAALVALAFFIALWATHPDLHQSIIAISVAGVAAIMARALFGPGTLATAAVVIAALGVIHHLYKTDRRGLVLLLGMGFIFALGYSTYLALYIRSGLNPVIDENDPETFAAFMSFLNREQYGTDSMLLSIFEPRASRVYQLWHQQVKYFLQQFPFPLFERDAYFRWATENTRHIISVSMVPYLLGLGGMIWHAVRDWRRFLAILSLFMIMGLGLSLYLNMPDPQPRERHYVFGGMYYAFALWMGLGWTGIVNHIRTWLSPRGWLLAACACVGLLLPAGTAGKLYHIEDRTGDYIAYDYAYNLLNSCGPNSILFTNGDNDTFPLWFLQEVEGVRQDVRVVNLSLLNTNWYIKQLRDRDPKVAIELRDDYIDSVLTDTENDDLMKRLWLEPKTPLEFKEMGLDAKVTATRDLLRVQDIMVIGIVRWNEWKRPIHFALTVAASNRVGLDEYLRMVGMTLRLVPEKGKEADPELLAHNLREVYRFRGVNDESVHKDVNTSRLLGNYRACVMTLAEVYKNQERIEDLADLFGWAAETIPMSWEGFYQASEYYWDAGQTEESADYLERAGLELLRIYGSHPSASYENGLAIGSILFNRYREIDRAETVYRMAMEREPSRYEAYHELAAALQSVGRTDQAIDVIVEYRNKHGDLPEAVEDEKILRSSRRQTDAGEMDSASTAADPSRD
jgi:hypothetical protein